MVDRSSIRTWRTWRAACTARLLLWSGGNFNGLKALKGWGVRAIVWVDSVTQFVSRRVNIHFSTIIAFNEPSSQKNTWFLVQLFLSNHRFIKLDMFQLFSWYLQSCYFSSKGCSYENLNLLRRAILFKSFNRFKPCPFSMSKQLHILPDFK